MLFKLLEVIDLSLRVFVLEDENIVVGLNHRAVFSMIKNLTKKQLSGNSGKLLPTVEIS